MILSIIKIINIFVKSNSTRAIISWSKRCKKGGMFPKLKNIIRDLLEKISGNI
jgi:hypothetical protein